MSSFQLISEKLQSSKTSLGPSISTVSIPLTDLYEFSAPLGAWEDSECCQGASSGRLVSAKVSEPYIRKLNWYFMFRWDFFSESARKWPITIFVSRPPPDEGQTVAFRAQDQKWKLRRKISR